MEFSLWPPKFHGVIGKALDCGIMECEFEFQSRYFVHFRINTLGKGMNHLIFSYGLKSTSALPEGSIWYQITQEWFVIKQRKTQNSQTIY